MHGINVVHFRPRPGVWIELSIRVHLNTILGIEHIFIRRSGSLLFKLQNIIRPLTHGLCCNLRWIVSQINALTGFCIQKCYPGGLSFHKVDRDTSAVNLDDIR